MEGGNSVWMTCLQNIIIFHGKKICQAVLCFRRQESRRHDTAKYDELFACADLFIYIYITPEASASPSQITEKKTKSPYLAKRNRDRERELWQKLIAMEALKRNSRFLKSSSRSSSSMEHSSMRFLVCLFLLSLLFFSNRLELITHIRIPCSLRLFG